MLEVTTNIGSKIHKIFSKLPGHIHFSPKNQHFFLKLHVKFPLNCGMLYF
jgi:hypothetical protein